MPSERRDEAIAVPTKLFFVSMLTRDISLSDAILDLVDNCLDGAMRQAAGGLVDYSRHFVEIKLSSERFSIEDNCGGIPREVAKKYAFKMGREPDDDRDSENETIGMYGVGLKRAIFKMGGNSIVQTLHGSDSYEVPITPEWLSSKDWNPLPMNDVVAEAALIEPGTRITVDALYPGVSKHFASPAFENELRTSMAEHFTMFLQAGLRIKINDNPIEPVKVAVLVADSREGPAPFVYRKVIDEVEVSITVGLNTGRGVLDDDDDVPEFERDRSSATAGWTVFCNDRAVIVGDKSRLTGWGDGIPLYHYQFSIITGVIEFRSKNAGKLPVTTTKRALDTSSDIWLEALVKMKEGMRVWITYTNQWKNHPRADQTRHWEAARPLGLREAVEAVAARSGARKSDGHIEFNPQKRSVLPEPPEKKPTSRKVVFSRPIEELQIVSKALFDRLDEKPGVIGDKCFETVLAEIRKPEE